MATPDAYPWERDDADMPRGYASSEELQQMGLAEVGDAGTVSIIWEKTVDPNEHVPGHRPPVLAPEAIRLVAEQLANEHGYSLDMLTSAVRRGRPNEERAGRLDALGKIVCHLRRTPAGANSRLIPDRYSPEPVATLDAIGQALGLSRVAVLRLERRGGSR